MPHADEVRWLPEACSEAPMQANLGAELGRDGDRLRSGSCIFLLDFAMVTDPLGRTIFGIAFDAGTLDDKSLVSLGRTVFGIALDDKSFVEYTSALAARRVASSSVRFAAGSPPLSPAASAKRSSNFCWYNASAS